MSAQKNPHHQIQEALFHQLILVLDEHDTHLRHQKFLDFIQKRTIALEKKAKITDLSLLNSFIYKGYLHSETRIRTNMEMVPFLVNDDGLYYLLLEKLYQFKHHDHWKNKLL